jgi:short subunit dehydrogenase-like uncharacterized protein
MTTQARSNWMLYGAYGSTGRLILSEALRRGHRPVLAGRDAKKLAALGQETGLDTRAFGVDAAAATRSALSGVSAVLLAAGPFQETGPAMRAACVAAGCSYLDVNGEIDEFAAALAGDAAARAAGVGVIPGVGYGVVFGESLAAQLAARLPDATWLRLSFATQVGARSRGAQLSTAATISAGGREIREGVLRKRALAFKSWHVGAPNAPSALFAATPLAEMLAAHRSTGIPNIVAGIELSRAAAVAMRVAGPLLAWVLTVTAARAQKSATQEAVADVSSMRSRIWAEAGNLADGRVAAMLETGEGYRAAAAAAVQALELQLQKPRVGALTPAQAFGAEFALQVPGTRVQQLH